MTTDTPDLDPALVEVAARAMRQEFVGYGGSDTTWQDYESEAKATIHAVLPSLRAQVAAEVLGPVLALATDGPMQMLHDEFVDALRALVTDPDAVNRHEAGVKAAALREVLPEWLRELADLVEPLSGIGLSNGATRADVAHWLRARADEVTR